MSTIDFYLLVSTFLLGFRHGIDWDHIAAILDLTGAGSIEFGAGGAAAKFHQSSIKAASWYALGHAFIVVALGLVIRGAAGLLPPWFYSMMEHVIGLTLVVFGMWIVLAIISAALFDKPAGFTSRGALVAALCDRLIAACKAGRPQGRVGAPVSSRRLPAFIIGVIHGVGAETTTQLILIASVAAASNVLIVAGLLLCFTAGLVCSNSLIALAACAGFLSVASVRPLYFALGLAASSFSIYVGACLLFGTYELRPIGQSIGWAGSCLQNMGVMFR